MKKSVATVVLCLLGTALGFAASRYNAPKQNDAPMLAPVIKLKNIEGREEKGSRTARGVKDRNSFDRHDSRLRLQEHGLG